MNHRETIALLHDYFIEALDAVQRRAVEEHLASCEECMELADVSRSLRDAAKAKAQGHPTSMEIVGFAMHKTDMQAEQLKEIESHLDDCESCSDEVQRIREIEATAQEDPAGPARKIRPTGWLALAATLLVALLSYPAYLGLTTDRSTPTGIVDLQLLTPSDRGQGERSQITIRGDAPFVLLAIELLVPREVPPQAAIEFSLFQAGDAPAWSSLSPADEVRETVRDRGFLILAIPVDALKVGTARLTIQRTDAREEPLATLGFDILLR